MTDNLKTWPERIWLQHGDDDGVPEFSGIWNSHGEIFWCKDSVEPHNVEYVRADLVKSDPAGSADHVNDAVEMVNDRAGIVWKVTFLDGSSCHYGVKSTAQAAAGKCGTIEAIELKDKRFRLVEPAGSAEPKPAFSKFPSLREYQKAMQAWRESAGSAGKVELPPLPEFGINTAAHYGPRIVGYTADQMHEYARAALSAQSTHQPDVSKSVGEIDMISSELNDACWAFVDAMPHQLPRPIFNDLKPAMKVAIEKYLLAAKGGE